MPASPVDVRIRELLAAGDTRRAATEALRALGPQVHRYLSGLFADDLEAADAFSLFAEAVWTSIAGYRGEASLRTWILRVAWSAASAVRRDAWRRRGRRLRTGEASALAEEIRTQSCVRVEQQRHKLLELRAELSLEEQSLLELRIDQELAWNDIAEVLSTPERRVDPVTLAKRFERLKQRLARLARERGLLGE